jgi:serine/threonine protein kinase
MTEGVWSLDIPLLQEGDVYRRQAKRCRSVERADIFAIGVMTVETLVGERPFGGQTPHEVLTTMLNSEYHLPGESIEIRALDAVVQRCLANDPRDRYGSATEAAKELVPALARCGGSQVFMPG